MRNVMSTKGELSRITIDLPKESHKKLKAMAAVLGKSMREVVVDMLDEHLLEEHIYCNNQPNKATIKAITDAKKGKGLVEVKDIKELFKKLGI